MMAAGLHGDSEVLSDKEYLDQHFESQHLKLYSIKPILQPPIVLFIYILFCFMIIEYGPIIEEILFIGALILAVELLVNIPRMKHNKTAVDVSENNNLVELENPRWITETIRGKSKVGYVDNLHPSDLERGVELGFYPHEFNVGGVHFIRNQKCFKHENKRGSETHYDRYDDTTYTSYFYYQIAYFKYQGKDLVLHSDDYSPAFDNSIKYNIVFQVSNVEENQIRGNILKVFVQEDSPSNIPEEWEGNVPNTPQRMNNNNEKAAIA